VNIFSRKTPAKPEMEAAASAALTPSQGAAPVGALDDFPSSDCTSATPAISSKKETHCAARKLRRRSKTVKKAVEMVLSW